MAKEIVFLNNNSVANITTNFERVNTALEDVLSLSGELPNNMSADLDMNGNDVLNVKDLDTESLHLNGTAIVASGDLAPIGAGSIGTTELADGAVTNPKLATDSVSTIKIVDENITEPKLANDSISTRAIVNEAVTEPKIAASFKGKLIVLTPDRATLAVIDTLEYQAVYLEETGREGVFIWDASDLSAEVSFDIAQAIFVPPTSDATGATGAWVRHDIPGEIPGSWLGLNADGSTSDSAAISGLLAVMPEGTTLHICADATLAVTTPIIIPSHKSLKLTGVTLRATSPYGADEAMIQFELDGDGMSLLGNEYVLDVNNNVKFAIHSSGGRGVSVQGPEIINWDYGIYMVSSSNRPARRLSIVDPYLHTPGTPATYPINVNSTTNGINIKGLEIIRPKVIGSGSGDYNPVNNATGDQIAIQGVEEFLILDPISELGGENGIAISRASRNGKVIGGRSNLNDKNGVQIGSSFLEFDVATAAGWSVGQTLTGASSSNTGVIAAIVDLGEYADDPARPVRVRLTTLSTGFFTNGESVTNGSQSYGIGRPFYTDSIHVIGLDTVDNGADTASTGASRAGFFLTRARWCSIVGGMIGNFAGTNQQKGIDAVSSIFSASGQVRRSQTTYKASSGPGGQDQSPGAS